MRKMTNKQIMSITAFLAVVLMCIPTTTSAQDSLLISSSDSLTTTSKDSLALTKKELKELKKQERYLQKKRKEEIKDSIKYIRDSTRWSEPRILKTYILEDSLKYKRLITWKHDALFNKIEMTNPDTTFHENFYVYPFTRRDVGATYLGVSGSATQTLNFFKKESLDIFEPFEPYLNYSYTPESVPFYNVKTPATELAYWGTLFANRDKEESNIKVMHTQNLSPSFNFNFTYRRYGGKGLLPKEDTDNRTLTITTNYLGEKYVMHSGYISQSVKRTENGGLIDDNVVLDSTKIEESKELAYNLQSASNHLKRSTFFLTHSYGIPIRWSKEDSTVAGEGTITYFGHTFDYSRYSKKYIDQIDTRDSTGRNFYNNIFLLSPTQSNDSIRVSSLENKVFIRVQPWAKDAVISKLDGGIGHQLLSIYNFKPNYYIQGESEDKHNNVFLFFGAEGNLKKYFRWDANARYNLTGYYANNFSLDGKAAFSFYPHKEGIHLTAKVELENKRPNWFNSSYFSNHYKWENNFDNITKTTLKGYLEIPRYKISAFGGYSIINNPIYYGIQGNVAQHNNVITVLAAYIQKDFKLGFLHLNNRVLFQMSSNKEIIPLPDISANLKYFMQFQLVKNVLTAQIGADITFNTAYYAQAYNPALGIFHNQNDREIGNYPYIDAFVNLQWKRASIFVKYLNAAQGWPNNDFFSAHHYIRPESAIQIGIHWPFYVK
ncbi:MAG: putative porin [Bacteroidales bacterium]